MNHLLTIGNLFSDRLFRIPDYQRGYAWEERQCQDFAEDLELLGQSQEHFMGLLILLSRSGDSTAVLSEKGFSYKVNDVVDGQQRLTTAVLFLDAIRREMEQFDRLQILASGVEDTFVAMRDLNGQVRSKLRLNRDTHPFFHDVILERGSDIKGPTIRSHQLLLAAKAYFAKYLQGKSQEVDDYAEWLKIQYLKITHQLTMVVYTVESEADAGVVFETMNNRGKELTELEKVKNYLLYLASKLDLPVEHDLEKRINDTWTHIFEDLMAADLGSLRNEDQLLRAHWLMAYDYDRRNWDGSRSIKGRFNLRAYEKRHQALLEDLTSYLTSLRNATVAYCDVFNPRHPNAFGNLQTDKELRAHIVSWGVRLARLDAPVTFLPLLMAVRLSFPDNGSAYLETVELCEKFAFRVYRLMEMRAYTGQSWMFRLGHRLYHGRDLETTLGEIRRGILYYASDVRFTSAFEESDADWFHWRGLKYLLYEYEHQLADIAGRPVLVPWEELVARKQDTIEHILPQTIEDHGYWAEWFTPDQHQRYVHDIGNLTLTYDNSALGNKPFPEKKGSPDRPGCYASSNLFVEQQLARYDDWTEAQILARRREIAEWAMVRWHVEPPESGDSGAVQSVASEGGEPIDLIREIQYVLTRKYISYGQMALYHMLYGAGDRWVPGSELNEAVRRRDSYALGGVLGALGVRINYTGRFKQERPGIKLLLEIELRDGAWSYRMRPELRAAIQDLPRLQELLAWPLEEIRQKYEDEWDADWSAQRRQLGL